MSTLSPFKLFFQAVRSIFTFFLAPYYLFKNDFVKIRKKFTKNKKAFNEILQKKGEFEDVKKNIFKNINNEMTFEAALASWGILEYGEIGINRAKRGSCLMFIGFLLLFLWLSFTVCQSILDGYVIATVTSVFGACSTALLSIFGCWRWWIFYHRQYISFFRWLRQAKFLYWNTKKKTLYSCIFAFILAASFITAPNIHVSTSHIEITTSIAEAVEQKVQIDLPDGVEIEKKTDVMAALFSRLFGDSWHAIVGGSQGDEDDRYERGGMGVFSGLIVSMLGTINMAAMVFCVGSIVYAWGIFGVSAASAGKTLGTSMYNTVWTPIRQFVAISFTVPVLNGLSLLQVAILAMVGLSINFANVVWDAAGEYIVSNLHVGIIDSSIPMLETEAYNAIPIMFSDSVIQKIEEIRVADGESIWNEDLKEQEAKERGSLELTVQDIEFYGINGKHDPDGPYVVKKDNINGILYLKGRPPKSLSFDAMGGVKIPYPTYTLTSTHTSTFKGSRGSRIWYTKPDTPEYKQSVNIAEIRLQQYIVLWNEISKHAHNYLRRVESGGNACVIPGSSGKACDAPMVQTQKPNVLVDNYRIRVTQETAGIITSLVKGDDQKRLQISKAIDSVADEGGASKSRYGWASAGMFTYSLAALQKTVDDEVLKTTRVIYRDRDSYDQANGWWIFKDKYLKKLTPNQRHAVVEAPNFVSDILLEHSRLAANLNKENGKNIAQDSLNEIVATAMKYLLVSKPGVGDNERDRSGLLGSVLDEFSRYDPIVVMSSFGNRLLAAANACLAISLAVSVAIKSFMSVMFVFSFYIFGATFAYIVPITPVIFWIRALVGWIYLVVESMFGSSFWACTHMLPGGDGFASQKAVQGYMMLLDILIRPVLLVVGAVIAIALMQSIGWLIVTLMNSWFTNIGETFISINATADITFSIIFMSIMYFTSLHIFTKGITFLPERISRWAGGAGSSLDESGDTQRNIVAVGAIFSRGQGAIGGAGHAGKEAYGGLKSKFSKGKGGSGGGGGPAKPNSVGRGGASLPFMSEG